MSGTRFITGNAISRFADVFVRAEKDLSTLSEAEQVQFQTYVFELLNLWEHVMSARQQGLMTESYWIAWNDTFHPSMKNSAWQTIWNTARTHFSAEFQSHVDSYI